MLAPASLGTMQRPSPSPKPHPHRSGPAVFTCQCVLEPGTLQCLFCAAILTEHSCYLQKENELGFGEQLSQ